MVVQTVKGYLPKDDGLKDALTGADVVVIPAGIPRMLPPYIPYPTILELN